MCVLTRDKILEYIRKGYIRIEPFAENQVGPGSVDLHLGSTFHPLRTNHKPYDVTEEATWERLTGVLQLKSGETIILRPGDFCLGITEENISLPPDVSGWIKGRSRFARIGLVVNGSSSFMHPGSCGRQILEISNTGGTSLRIRPGLKICQLIVEGCAGEAIYEGKFQNQNMKEKDAHRFPGLVNSST